jgi:LPS-assembly protein
MRLDPELRYLDEDTRSQLNVEYLFYDNEREEARSFVDWRHVTRFAPLTRLRVDAANVSDRDYFEDFGVGFEGTSVTFLNRYIDLRHDQGAWSFVARAQDYQVIDRELPDDESPYRIVPQLTALGAWDLAGGFGSALYLEATTRCRP